MADDRSDQPPGQRLAIPAAFAQKMRVLYGEAGQRWLAGLPALVADLARQWQIAVGPPFALSYNYVAAARRQDGTDAVLKVGVPHPELDREIVALRLYAGDGACRLLEADEARSAMLLDRLRPGEMLVRLARTDDDAATRVGAAVLRTLWRPVPESADGRALLPIAAWFRAFERHRAAHAGGAGPLPERVLAHAESVTRDLLASAPADVVLHGDFHHANVLSANNVRSRGSARSAGRLPWLAIDPKGMRGDPGYEVGPFLLNPHPERTDKDVRLLNRRLDILAEALGYDRARLRDWGIAHAVLSACWSAEDEGSGWEGAIATAEALISR